MQIQHFFDERTFTLTYVVFDEKTKDAVIIDPVLDYDPAASKTWTESVDEVIRFTRDNDLNVKMILETHAHADHISGAPLLKQHYRNAKLAIGERITEVQKMFRTIFGLPSDFPTDGSQFDMLLTPGETYEVGSLKFKVLATPGHTPACASYVFEDAVFTGDALFNPDIGTGRCDFPGGSATDLYHSVHDVLYSLPEDTKVYVGHDYPPESREVKAYATIAEHKESNVALPAKRDAEDFIKWREERDSSLNAPRLLFQSVQLNIDAGRLPEPEGNEISYLRIPLNVFRPEPKPDSDLTLEQVDK